MIPLLEKITPVMKPVSDAIAGFIRMLPEASGKFGELAGAASFFSPLGLVLKALERCFPRWGRR